MLKRMFTIFKRDFKVNTREFLSLYILIFPILFAIGINLLAPGISDTTVDLALIDGDNPQMVEYFEDFANIELFEDEEAIIERIEKRDQIVGIIPDDSGYYILTQGNEESFVVDYAKMIKTYYEAGAEVEDTTATIESFGKTVPPLKTMFVNLMLLMTSVLGGMLIAVNIIEEKGDNTISAMHLTPVSRLEYVFSKSIMGVLLSVYGCVALLLITGYGNVNIMQAVLAILACSLISILVGFIEGIKNDDVMSAAAGVKMLFLPLGGAIAAVELLSDKWQILFYWIPFYWSYKGNAAILTQDATWPQILLYTAIVIGLSGAVFAILAPQIRKGLE